MNTTIIIVDDHPVIRRGLRAMLEPVTDLQVIGEASDGFEAIRIIEDFRPMVVLLDLMMKGVNGIEVARQLTKNSHPPAIIIFSVLGSERYVLEALRAGVMGYLLKDSPFEELITAIRTVVAGNKYLCSQLSERSYLQQTTESNTDLLSKLTAREQEVLQLSAQGNSCAEIAQDLSISRRTVEAHRANVMRKLGLPSQAALYRYAFQNGMAFNNKYQLEAEIKK